MNRINTQRTRYSRKPGSVTPQSSKDIVLLTNVTTAEFGYKALSILSKKNRNILTLCLLTFINLNWMYLSFFVGQLIWMCKQYQCGDQCYQNGAYLFLMNPILTETLQNLSQHVMRKKHKMRRKSCIKEQNGLEANNEADRYCGSNKRLQTRFFPKMNEECEPDTDNS